MHPLDSLVGVAAVIPAIGPWVRDKWLLRTNRGINVYCRRETSYFLRDPEHSTGLIVLHLVVENQVGRQLWIKRLELDALVDEEWITRERWPADTYAASWGTGWRICNAEERIDAKVDKHLPLEPMSSAGGYTIHRIGTAIADTASLTCRVTLNPSQGEIVTTTIGVLRHINERKRTDVKILQGIHVGINRRYFHCDESSGETITIPRFVYEAIMNSNRKQGVQMVKHWELTDSE